MKLEKRTEKLNKVREQRLVPGVVYGKEIESTPVQAEFKEFADAYSEYGMSMTFKAKLGRKTHQVYFKEVQVDPLRHNHVLHFDLQKVSATDSITAEIPVVLVNKEQVEDRGLVVELIASSIETEFPAGEGISNFELDVSGLEGNEALHVSDLDLPEGFKVLAPEDKIIVSISYPQEEEEIEEEVDEDEELEVEAIKQKDEDEEETDEDSEEEEE